MTYTVKTTKDNSEETHIYEIEAKDENELKAKLWATDSEYGFPDDYEILGAYYNVCSYEVGGPDYGNFETFDKAKEYACELCYKLHEDFSVIKFEHGNGEEIWSTRQEA